MIHPSELGFGGKAMKPLVPHFCIRVSPVPVAQVELSRQIPAGAGRGVIVSSDDIYATVYDPIMHIYSEDESWWFNVEEAAKVMDAVVHIVLDSEKPCDIRYGLVGLEHWVFRDEYGLWEATNGCEMTVTELKKIREGHPQIEWFEHFASRFRQEGVLLRPIGHKIAEYDSSNPPMSWHDYRYQQIRSK